jgi:sortase A
MKTLRRLILLAIVAGTCLTGRALYLHAKAALAAVLIRRAWDKTLLTGAPQKPWSWADMHPVARLHIPRLNYDEIVLDGATPRALAFGPARLRSGAAFGEPGNLVLAGHRTSWFEPIQALVPGDVIEVTWSDSRNGQQRRRTHSVQTVQIVKPEDVSLLTPTADDALTLVTCYPFGRGPHSPLRYVVRARPRGEAQGAALSASP